MDKAASGRVEEIAREAFTTFDLKVEGLWSLARGIGAPQNPKLSDSQKP